MKALYKYAPGGGTSRLEDRPIPQITPLDNVRVRVSACAVCGMDIHIYHGKFACDPPFVMGHEFVGRVESVEPEVTSVAPGDRVVAQPHLYACGSCQSCRDGFPQYCPQKRSLGINRDGAMAEYVVLPDRYLHKVPDAIPDPLACLLEPMTILVGDVIAYSGLQPGDTVVITGAGQVAQLALIAAKAGGAGRVVMGGVTSDRTLRFPAALALGADAVVDSNTEDLSALVMKLTDGRGADLAIEASGSEAGINNAISCLRTGGRLTVLGLTRRDSVAVQWDTALRKMLTVRYHMMSNYRMMERSIEIFATYPRDLSPLVTHTMPLEEWKRMFDILSQGGGIKGVMKIIPGY
ncbi:MAG: alcohol dehydrogenase catalytic domain-containing protein [Angelakisella sp.]|jgi:L-iditol 2-dehydrogenase|nr:alcohol dehydrogenase catalytic domain-containing protein [Angelakisella sp.]